EVALAALWRHEGSGSAGGRVPPYLLPCDDPEYLCVSCRLFGATKDVATGEDDRGAARQDAYRAHVRVADAVGNADARLEPEPATLPPLGTPRLGAGQFYLELRDRLESARAK